jgi:riboflavin biosynthesis pyrimidine reductase
MVPGASPIRVVLDSTLRIPDDSLVLGDEAATTIVTTDRSSPERRDDLRRRGISIVIVPAGPSGVELDVALTVLREQGIRSALVEGGASVITSFLAGAHADRLIVGIAPRVLGSGTDAVQDLGVREVARSLRLERRHPLVPTRPRERLASRRPRARGFARRARGRRTSRRWTSTYGRLA